jgi:misacylated tRNA(Ala) deacylase
MHDNRRKYEEVPMTELLYHQESYLKEFDATITDVVDGGVVLDRTAFYTGGGGQPSDSGTLIAAGQGYQVTGVKRADGNLVHQIAGDLPAAGATVQGVIDWDRRYLLMRTHTALHILCGVVWRDYGALVTGGDMKPGEGRMDFEFENFSAEFVDELEMKVNAEVAENRDIHAHNLTREEADQVPDLIRTKINLLPPNIQEIRTIDIKGLDLQADGGTHVANTREVGVIKIVGHESKGRINKRIRIALED